MTSAQYTWLPWPDTLPTLGSAFGLSGSIVASKPGWVLVRLW